MFCRLDYLSRFTQFGEHFWPVVLDWGTPLHFFQLCFKPPFKLRPVDEKGVKTSLYQKEKLKKMETMFPRPKERRNPSDPFNMGFSHKHSKVDLSTVLLSFDITILNFSGITRFSPFKSDPIVDSAPRILDMSERECPVEGGRTTRVRVSREDVQVEFYDKSCSWSAAQECVPVSQAVNPSKRWGLLHMFKFPNQSDCDLEVEVEVEVPEFPTEVTSRHEVLMRLVPGEGESPGPPVPFYYTPRTRVVEEKVEQVEEDYITLLKKATENIPTQPVKPRIGASVGLMNQEEEEEAHKQAKQKEMVETFFK